MTFTLTHCAVWYGFALAINFVGASLSDKPKEIIAVILQSFSNTCFVAAKCWEID